ncbi:MAG TPA: hypothetical protein VEU47_16490, partial [Candidatus Cybelea sp.]|nr:hypothetical protein [Candidatus Cybelea sp.]
MFLAMAVLLWLMPGDAALAQAPLKQHDLTSHTVAEKKVELPQGALSDQQIDALMARLSDADVRRLLIEQLKRMSGEAPQPTAAAEQPRDMGSLGALEATA